MSVPGGRVGALDGEWRSFLAHLECSACGVWHDADRLQTVCSACGKVLLARYDLVAAARAVRPADFAARRWDLWRYRELLPLHDPAYLAALGEGMTPLVPLRRDSLRVRHATPCQGSALDPAGGEPPAPPSRTPGVPRVRLSTGRTCLERLDERLRLLAALQPQRHLDALRRGVLHERRPAGIP